jgi:hypothetical protein
MPTLTVTHEAPLELIRQHPDLAVDLVQAMTDVPVPAGGRARLGPTDANSVVPAQFTADSVVIVDDPLTGRPALVIVVEPQGREDKTKSYAWPAYLANIREAVQCPRAVLIVVCPDPRARTCCCSWPACTPWTWTPAPARPASLTPSAAPALPPPSASGWPRLSWRELPKPPSGTWRN